MIVLLDASSSSNEPVTVAAARRASILAVAAAPRGVGARRRPRRPRRSTPCESSARRPVPAGRAGRHPAPGGLVRRSRRSACCGWRPTGRCTTSARSTCTRVHMVQHLLLTLVVPPLMSCWPPRRGWPASCIGDGRVDGVAAAPGPPGRRPACSSTRSSCSRHWPVVVNASVEQRRCSTTALHLLLVVAALLHVDAGVRPAARAAPRRCRRRWSTCSSCRSCRRCPAAWLTFAEGAVYTAYDIPDRLWGIVGHRPTSRSPG